MYNRPAQRQSRLATVAMGLCVGWLMVASLTLVAAPASAERRAPEVRLGATSYPVTTTTPSATPADLGTPTPTGEQPTGTSTPLPGPTPTFTPTPCGPSPTPATDFQVEVQVDGNVVRGHTTPGGQVSASLANPTGAIVATRQGRADADGAWAVELVTVQANITSPVAIRPDWLVRVSAPNGSAEVRPISMTVTMDPPRRQIVGRGPPSQALALRTSFTSVVIPVQTDAQGRFVSPWPFARQPAAGEWAEIIYCSEPNQVVFARDRIASLIVELDSPVIQVSAPPLAHVAVSVEKWTGPTRDILAAASATTNGWGDAAFFARNQKAGNAPLPIAPGLTVLATSNAAGFSHRITVEGLSGAILPGGEGIGGQGPPNTSIYARLRWREDPRQWCVPIEAERRGVSDGAGVYTIPLKKSPVSDALPRPAGELAQVMLFYQTPALDEVRRPIPPTFGALADTIYLPAAQRYSAPPR